MLLLLFGAGLVFTATQTDFIGSTLQDSDCRYEPYQLDGQTFFSLEQAKTTYQNLGGQNWTQLKENADLQVRDGVVNARVCEHG